MHILFVTDNFSPEVNAPASRTFEHCREWVQAGHQVTVITGVPNFPKGKVFDGYRNRLWQREKMAGINVVRVWTYMAANQGFGRRALDFLSFMVMAVLAGIFIRRPDVVIGTSPQFFTACAAYAIGAYKRVPFIFELRDLWPESIRAVGAMKSGWLFTLLERLELFLYRRASLIVSVTQSFKKQLASRGIDPNKIVVVTNGADLNRYVAMPKDPVLVERHNLQDKFVVGYVGTIGMAHGLEIMLNTAEYFSKREDGDRYRFVLLGEGAQKQALENEAKKIGLSNLLFLDSVSKDEVCRYWSILDASLIHLKASDLFQTVIPSKLFECMAMGIPVLLGVKGEAASIVNENCVGIVFEPENATLLSHHILQLGDKPELRNAFSAQGIASAKLYERRHLAMSLLGRLQNVSPAG